MSRLGWIVLLWVLVSCGQPVDPEGSPSDPPVMASPSGTPEASPTLEPSPTPAVPTPTQWGLPPRRANTDCRIDRFAEPSSGFTTERVFPNLVLENEPVLLTHAGDGTGQLYVVEKLGTIWRIDGREPEPRQELFLDISERLHLDGREPGLLSMAFHPDFESNGEFFLKYNRWPYHLIVSRWKVVGVDRKVDVASEEVVLDIEVKDTNHNGGMIAFGPDGYLYVGFGDGGGQSDPYHNGQDPFTLQAAMVRIDVDHPGEGSPYSIPPDNPYADGVEGAPEVWAWGMRNPWRWSIDFETGQLWLGDVGQNTWEEIDLIEPGGNYGWPVMEGGHCWEPPTGCDTEGKVMPVVEYSHSIGAAVVGGYVYRGRAFPELVGSYLYADYQTGQVWAMRYEEGEVKEHRTLMDTSLYISSFGVDEDGELYFVSLTGPIHRLTRTAPSPYAAPFPRLLSETGCFEELSSMSPSVGVLPYEVSTALWSDGDSKRRWLALPGLEDIEFFEKTWSFPSGTILLKEFAIDLVEGDPTTRRRLETRLLLQLGDAWSGYTYRWNDAQTDAELLEGPLDERFTRTRADGSTWEYLHHYPSRQECQACHTLAAKFVLGVRTGSINRQVDYGHVVANQLDALDHSGYFKEALPAPPAELAAWPDPMDEGAPLADRARSYLQMNCAHCHMPGGAGLANIDLRYESSLSKTKTCNKMPTQGDLGVEGAMILTPGRPDLSVLSLRMHTTGAARMPPLATHVVDEAGVAVVDAWIASLTSCDE